MLGEVSLTVDGHPVALAAELGDSLLRALRDAGRTQVTGACEQGECGSCSVRARRAAGGLVPGGRGRVRRRRRAHRARACSAPTWPRRSPATARCSAGSARRASWWRPRPPSPPRSTRAGTLPAAAVREALAGNLCRCTGYEGIVAAVVEVAAAAVGRSDA